MATKRFMAVLLIPLVLPMPAPATPADAVEATVQTAEDIAAAEVSNLQANMESHIDCQLRLVGYYSVLAVTEPALHPDQDPTPGDLLSPENPNTYQNERDAAHAVAICRHKTPLTAIGDWAVVQITFQYYDEEEERRSQRWKDILPRPSTESCEWQQPETTVSAVVCMKPRTYANDDPYIDHIRRAKVELLRPVYRLAFSHPLSVDILWPGLDEVNR